MLLVPGHKHMECDVYHSVIEKRKNKKHLYTIPLILLHQLVRNNGLKKKLHIHKKLQDEFLHFFRC